MESLVVDKVTEVLPTVSVDSSQLTNFKNLPLADDTYAVPGEIDLLIGASIFPHLLLSNKVQGQTARVAPCALETVLGYVIVGSAPALSSTHATVSCCCAAEPLDLIVRKFWELEEVLVPPILSPEDKECEDIYAHTTTREDDGRYTVAVPFKGDSFSLGNSRRLAEKCFLCLERKMQALPKLKQAYDDVITEYLEKGYITMAPPETDESITAPSYIIPHHGVIREDKLTSKLRVVLNGSAKTSTSVSLNDILHSGPNLQGDLFSIILNFRLFAVALSADIRQMLLCINVRECDRRFQRILYRYAPEHPRKVVSLARLELCATLVLARLVSTIIDACNKRHKINKVYAFSDSTVSLCWIHSSPHRWDTFVANRVSKIQSLISPQNFYHVPGVDNPADCLSRGLTPAQIINHPLWFHGPSWTSFSPSKWPITAFEPSVVSEPPEEKKHTLVASIPNEESPIIALSSRFSSWNKAAVVGPTGNKGDKGAKGKHGPRGFPGIEGEMGWKLKGNRGLSPPKGKKGAQGEMGLLGPQGPEGRQGEKGEEGIRGETGFPGLDGVPGDQGYAGYKGVKGDHGANGIVGQIGTKGIMGNKGPIGLPGPPGVPGPNRLTKYDGKDENGEKGYPGLPGLPGPPGLKGDVGYPGHEGAVGRPGYEGMKGSKGLRGLDIRGSMGPKGDAGEYGLPGQDGPRGPTGVDGEKGDTGPPGALGPIGLEGLKGSKGELGLPGLRGIPGPPGLPGEMGTQGEKGDRGFWGPFGTQGETGEIGRKGEKGQRGADGMAGYHGMDGEKGDTGEQGIPGLQGPPGRRGLKGYPGLPGIKGDQGPTGKEGKHGIPGDSGMDGVPGEKGDIGVLGLDGPPGQDGEKGMKGESGLPGVPGLLNGFPGTKGDKGVAGDKGNSGGDGKIGFTGFRGERGRRGSKGEKGNRGELGRPGSPGFVGEKGNSGLKGLPGLGGLDGPMGPEGQQGEKGNKGQKGWPGPVGPPGTTDKTCNCPCTAPGGKYYVHKDEPFKVSCTMEHTCVIPKTIEDADRKVYNYSSYGINSNAAWLSQISPIDFKSLYGVTKKQIQWLQERSSLATQILKIHYKNFTPTFGPGEDSFTLLTWNNVVVGSRSTSETPLFYNAIQLEACDSQAEWCTLNLILNSQSKDRLPIVDVLIKKKDGENPQIKLESGKLCYN